MKTNSSWQKPTTQILKDIDDYLTQHQGPAVAAFDADGTCWFNDVGRDFYLYQCSTVFKSKYSWQDYLEQEKVSVAESLWWLAEINANRSADTLIQEAEKSLEKNPLRLIPSQKALIEHLHQKGVEVFIVTASVKWSVIPAAKALGVNEDHVLGVTTLLDSQRRLGSERKPPITWRDGKPLALLEATQGVKPFLCSGNTISDWPLLQESSHFKISVMSAPKEDTSLYESELKLKEIFLKNSQEKIEQNLWHHFDYDL